MIETIIAALCGAALALIWVAVRTYRNHVQVGHSTNTAARAAWRCITSGASSNLAGGPPAPRPGP